MTLDGFHCPLIYLVVSVSFLAHPCHYTLNVKEQFIRIETLERENIIKIAEGIKTTHHEKLYTRNHQNFFFLLDEVCFATRSAMLSLKE